MSCTSANSDPFKAKRKLERSPSSKISPPNKMSQCKLCNTQIRPQKQSVNCSICSSGFHIECIDLSPVYLEYMQKNDCNFICEPCKNNELVTKDFIQSSLQDFMDKMEATVESKLQSVVTAAVQPLQDQIFKIDSLIQSHINRMDNLEKRLSKMEQSDKNESTLISDMQKEIIYLKSQIKQSCIIVSGVPEANGENLIDVVQRIGAALQVRVEATNIKNIYRMKNKRKETALNKPSSIAVEFTHGATRDRFMENFINRMKKKVDFKCQDIGMDHDGKIYINKHLPKEIMNLFAKCKILKEQGKIQHAVTRPNHVLIKKDDRWFNIQELNDLVKLGVVSKQ